MYLKTFQMYWILFIVVIADSYGAALVTQTGKHLPVIQEALVWYLSGEDPLEKGIATHSSILSWKILWSESLVSYSPWGRKESDTAGRLRTITHV